jgi:hypothetical protein
MGNKGPAIKLNIVPIETNKPVGINNFATKND